MKTKRKFSSDKPTLGKSVPKKLNPFEIHINRSKHQVLGRKLKSDQGLPGISKNKAIQKRKKTLLQEYKMKGKNNNFIDQRIGERNANMTEDDRIMARFTAERMRMFNKKTMFNLSDSEVLTHRGQTLSEIEKFEDIKSDDEEDEVGSSGALKRKFVEEAHFGGGMLTKNSKDRESLIDELINESKKRKAERQRNKEETLEATEQLDEDWKTLGMIVTAPKDTDELANSQKNDKYDVVMRQLKFEPQGQASQRLKTDEEVAKEDKEQLEKLEKERLKQLREIEAVKYKNHRSADDLDDGFSYSVDGFEDKATLQKSDDESSESSEEENEGELNDKEEEESDEESESSDNVQDDNEDSSEIIAEKELWVDKTQDVCKIGQEKDLEIENDENELSPDSELSEDECAMDDLTDLMPPIAEKFELKKSQKLQPEKLEHKKDDEEAIGEDLPVVELDLPYILKVPENFEDFKEMIGKYVPQQLNIILERIVKSNHPNLDPENKKKMLNLAEFIILLMAEGELCWGAVPVLVTHFNIIKSFNREACLNLLLQSMPSAESSTAVMKFVVWYCLVFLKPEGMEMLLPVSRPVLALVCQIMSQAGEVSPSRVVTSLLSSYLLLQDAKTSSTLYLEPLKFLHYCMISFNEESSLSPKKSKDASKSVTQPQKTFSKSCIPENIRIILTDLDNQELKLSEVREQVLHYVLVLTSDFVKVYRKYPQSKILFKPLQSTVNKIKTDRCSKQIQEEVIKLKDLLEVLQSAQLPSLVKDAKKPKALRQYEPAIHAVTIGKWNYGLPADKREEQKLLYKYKQEMKGAMRELRRDGAFLANLKLKERIYSDEQRVKKVKEIFGSAAEQQGELRKLKRKK